jgi:hypothetical protein
MAFLVWLSASLLQLQLVTGSEQRTRTAPAPFVVHAVIALEGGTEATSAGRYTNVKLGADKLPLVLYNRDGGGIVRARHCGDAACSSLTAANISDQSLISPYQGDESSTGGNKGRFIDLVMAKDGSPLAVWAGPYIHLSWCRTPSCSKRMTTTLHHGQGAYPSIAIGEDGMPRVVYYLEAGLLQLITCTDIHCINGGYTNSLPTVLASGAGVGKYPSLGICHGGLPCVAFQDSAAGHLLFVVCIDTACTRANAPVIIDASSNELGTYISMKVGVDGRPVMMYADERTGAIKVAHCGEPDCVGGVVTLTAIDHVGVGCYGEFPELDISPLNGFPILSYFNQTNKTSGGLRITQCGDAACSDRTLRTSQTVLTGKCGFGRDTSIAIAGTRQAPTVYVSFLDYNGDGRAKRAGLAVLKPAADSCQAALTSCDRCHCGSSGSALSAGPPGCDDCRVREGLAAGCTAAAVRKFCGGAASGVAARVDVPSPPNGGKDDICTDQR